jgi:transporter family protein
VIGIVIAGYVYFTDKWSNPFTLRPRTLSFLALSGLATGASWVCYFGALKTGAAAKVVPVDKLSVVVVAIFAFVFLGERPSTRELAGNRLGCDRGIPSRVEEMNVRAARPVFPALERLN